MLVLDNACFIHFPKTGGTWVRQALLQAGVPFEDYTGNHAHIGYKECPFNDRFRFAFVRHPVAYFRSYWQFKMTAGWDPDNAFDMECQTDDFERFVVDVTTRYPGGYGHNIVHALGEHDTEIDFIGRFEHLADDLVRALQLCGTRFDEAKLRATRPRNVSNKHSYPVVFTQELKDRIVHAERPMMARFGYEDAAIDVFNNYLI